MKFTKYKLSTFILFFLMINITACDITSDMRAKSSNKEVAYARTIAAGNGCMGCHSVGNKVIGPAWKRVAQHYKDDPTARHMLIKKIQNGGKGNWDHVTGGVKMPAFKDNISEEDIGIIVDYILAL